ncbi:MAG: TetR/AcrR family transcriptional regulator [Myxococcota bacterium]
MPTRKTSKTRRKRPQQARSRATVDALLEAAAQLFERHGVGATTTDRIAERAGVSVGSLYQYFGDKQALLVALSERHLDEGEAVVRAAFGELAAPDRPLDEWVAALIETFVALHRERPALHRVLTEEGPLPTRVRRRVEALEAAAVEALAGLLRQRTDVRVPDSRLAAHFLVVWVDAVAHRLVLHPPDGVTTEALCAEAERLIVAYLASGDAPTGRRAASR